MKNEEKLPCFLSKTIDRINCEDKLCLRIGTAELLYEINDIFHDAWKAAKIHNSPDSILFYLQRGLDLTVTGLKDWQPEGSCMIWEK